MNLVFKDYIRFLNDSGIELELQEGYYWLDNQIIKAYDVSSGNLVKIVKILIDSELNVSFKYYKNKPFIIESWKQTVERKKEKLLQLELNSLNLIAESIEKYNNRIPIILTSGGKDSSVVLYLTRLTYPDSKAIFGNTSLDCADTYLYVKQIPNIEIINPKEGFFQWRERLQFVPTRFSRACCTIFKEGAMIETLNKEDKYLFFMGMRNEESATRSTYQDEWKNNKWKERLWMGILPIREWSEEDIWLYILFKNININSKYKKGYARVGCAIACPFYSKSTWVLDKYWYPSMYNRWQNILKNDFLINLKWTRLNCTLSEYKTSWNGGLVRKHPTIDVIQEYAKYKDIPVNIAERFFNKNCNCGNKVNDIAVGLTMKLYGRNVEFYKCFKCLGKDFNKKRKELKELAKQFKQSGCNLF